MRIYKLTIDHPEYYNKIRWYSSEAKAKRARAEYRRENPDEPDCSGDFPIMHETEFEIEKYDIPTDKAGLIRWLNSNIFH